MEYIEEALNLPTYISSWKYLECLPIFMTKKYDIKKVKIGNVDTLFMAPRDELIQPFTMIEKHIALLKRLENIPVVILLKEISYIYKKYLISKHIPFVVLNKQIYLPFLGTILQNTANKEYVNIQKFLPSTQVLFFLYLYKKQQCIYFNEAIEAMKCSGMTMTRIASQLENTDLFSIKKDGRKKMLCSQYDMQTLFNEAQPYLISPIRKIFYIDKSNNLNLKDFFISGESALSQMSMLNEPLMETYAIKDEIYRWEGIGSDILIDPANCIKLEIWKYNPNILCHNNMVDPLSLTMIFRNSNDARVEQAIDEILKEVGVNKL